MAEGPADPLARPRRPYAAPRLIQWAELGLQEAGHLWLRVQGASMLPFLRAGDRLELRPLDARPPRPGDLLVFIQDGQLVVHRLLRREGDRCLTAGDALDQPDPWLSSADILGRAVALACDWGRADLDRRPWPQVQALLATLLRRRLAGGPSGRLAARLQAALARALPPLLAEPREVDAGGVG